MAEEGAAAAREQNETLERFFAGADLLVHDAQYTRAEYEAGRVGLGHTAIEDAIAAARRAGVRRLALFHHDPERTDAQLDRMTAAYCTPGTAGAMDLFFAREGQEIVLRGDVATPAQEPFANGDLRP